MRTLIIIAVLVLTTMAYSQKKAPASRMTPEQKHMEQFLEMRKRLLQEFHHSFGSSMLQDDFFEQSMESFFDDDMTGIAGNSFTIGGNFESSWEETDEERIFVIKPQNKEIPLDIKIKDQMISIQSKQEVKTKTGKASSSSSFSSNFSLPRDVDGEKALVEQRGEEILVRLPKKKVSGDNRPTTPKKLSPLPGEPLKPNPGDITI